MNHSRIKVILRILNQNLQSHGADSWFPGYKWRLCTCPHCGQHIGWTFHSSPELKPANSEKDNVDSFHGIILKNVLGENCKYKIFRSFAK